MQKPLKICSFKEMFYRFVHESYDTLPKDCDKINQIIPIMQEHLGLVMNLSRIKLLTFALHALCIVQTVSLHKIASAMPTSVERDPNLRRVRPG